MWFLTHRLPYMSPWGAILSHNRGTTFLQACLGISQARHAVGYDNQIPVHSKSTSATHPSQGRRSFNGMHNVRVLEIRRNCADSRISRHRVPIICHVRPTF